MLRLRSVVPAIGAGLTIWAGVAQSAPVIDPSVRQHLDSAGVAPVVLTYRSMPDARALARLSAIGITGGYTFRGLPMVVANVTAAQLDALSRRDELRSIYGNIALQPHLDRSHVITGLLGAARDVELRAEMVNRGVGTGLPATGRGIGVAVIDTGVDATHPDLKLGANVVQNVYFPTADSPLLNAVSCAVAIATGQSFASISPDLGFAPQVAVENAANPSVFGGHGTFVAGVIGGTGAASGGKYTGVAPGARIVGLTAGNECGLPLHAILQAFDYVKTHQIDYNIHVVNNSWGSRLSAGGLDPANPINVATRALHDLGITVVFSAGNAGDTPTSINPYSTMPWVISVAASRKDGLGQPADFSSRGKDNGAGVDVATCAAHEECDITPNLRPDITAPGVDIKAARSKFLALTNTAGTVPLFVGANDLTTIDPGHLPYYTTSRGTSFSAPHISGIVALMKQLNPLLTPGEVVTLLRETATPMPYEERVVGAGYVDANNALRRVYELDDVAHPRVLFPDANSPVIDDDAGDALGTGAQDIINGDIRYDAGCACLVYTLTLANMSQATTNAGWEISSDFTHPTTEVVTNVFVAAYMNADFNITYTYGRIAPNPTTGVGEIEDLGPVAGSVSGNTIRMELPIAAINQAVGFDVLGATATAVEGSSKLTVGPSFPDTPARESGPFGLVASVDSAAGRDFVVE